MRIRRFVDKILLIYLTVGVVNFIVCTYLMFILYNGLHVSEHLAPVVNYGLGSVIWYVSCRYLVFRGRPFTFQQVLRFLVEILICYGVSYYLIAPLLAGLVLQWESALNFFDFGGAEKIAGNCEMTIGAIVYAVLNYFGQRYFVFSRRFELSYKKTEEKERTGEDDESEGLPPRE